MTGHPDLELSVSWSRLRAHAECKQKAYLQAQGRKSAVGDIRTYFHGTVVDICMRTWLNSPSPQPGQMAAMVDEVMDKAEVDARETGDGVVRWRTPGDRDNLRVWCRELVTRLEPILYQYVIPLEYEPAKRFKTPLVIPYLDGSQQRIWLTGEMDLLTRNPQAQYYVWDLKGTADSGYWRKVTGQLLFYDLAAACMFGGYPAGCGLIQPMCPEQVLPFTFTAEHRAQLVQQVMAYCADVWRRDNAPKASTQGCDRCEVQHACARYAVPGGRGRTTALA